MTPKVAPAWVAPVPHGGQPTALLQWWSQFEDPALVAVIEAAQKASPSLASAAARIERARADRVAAGASLVPQLGAVGSATRGRADTVTPLGTTSSVGLQASWEIDLFGAARAGRDAQDARLAGAQAAWHSARVAVAAEAASSYNALRACEAQRVQTELDSASRAETARVSDKSARAGLLAPGNAAVARAGAAQARTQVSAQRAQCDILVKSLVALTALDEPTLRGQLATGYAKVPQAAPLAVAEVPAALLAQRPDLVEAAAAVSAAAADRNAADARQWPTVSLSGSLGALRTATAPATSSGRTWSLGPLQVTFPIFDGGIRAANRAAAQATYQETVAAYLGRVRQAVREVEEALVDLASTEERAPDARQAADDYEVSLKAADARFRNGLASVFELEDARRSAVSARSALVELQRQRTAAWITLYRALGGGWTADAAVPVAAAPQP